MQTKNAKMDLMNCGSEGVKHCLQSNVTRTVKLNVLFFVNTFSNREDPSIRTTRGSDLECLFVLIVTLRTISKEKKRKVFANVDDGGSSSSLLRVDLEKR